MPGYNDLNRPEWTGKRKAKNFARINAACLAGSFILVALRRQTADGMPQVRHKPQVRGLPRVRMPATKEEIAPHAPPSPAGLFIPQPLTQGVNMTIGELIKKLENFDPEQDVCITLDGSEGAGMFDIDPQPTECACEDAKGKTFTETIIGLYPGGAAVEEAE